MPGAGFGSPPTHPLEPLIRASSEPCARVYLAEPVSQPRLAGSAQGVGSAGVSSIPRLTRLVTTPLRVMPRASA